MMTSANHDNELNTTSWVLHGLGLVSAIASASAIYLLVIAPVNSKADLYESNAIGVVDYLQSAESIKAKNERLVKDVRQQQRQWDSLLKQLPETTEESTFLAQITSLSQINQLKIGSFNPGGTKETETCSEREIRLTFVGSYPNLCRFLAGLHSITRVAGIKHMVITTPNQVESDDKYMVAINFQLAYGFKEPEMTAQL